MAEVSTPPGAAPVTTPFVQALRELTPKISQTR